MEESSATESPMYNGDGMTEEQSPVVEEENMTTTVLKGEDARVSWPGGEGDATEHVPYPDTIGDTESETLNGKEPISAEAFFDEAFGSEDTPDATEEPEFQEDTPPPIEEESIAQTVKADASPSIDFAWPSENAPETPSENESTVFEPSETEPSEHSEPEPEPENLSPEPEKMGVKGDSTTAVESQHNNNEEKKTTDSNKDSRTEERSLVAFDTEEGEEVDSMSTQDVTSPAGDHTDNGDVVRSQDEQEETRVMTSPGGLRSVKDQFEGGNVSNVEVKKLMDEEVIRPTAMQNDENAPEGINSSGISENEPVFRDDVVRAGTPSDDPMSASGGTRSLKDRFEKGQTSSGNNEDQITSPSKIDVTAEIEEAKRREEEVRRSEPTVSENEPLVRDDVIRAGDTMEDIQPESGALGSLKDRFEKGTVSNIEDTPKKDQIKIGSLDNFNNESNQGGISENTPLVRDDVVHSSDTTDDPGVKKGTSRSLKAMFESGPVSNLEQKPREKIDISPRSLEDSYAANESANASGVSENTPLVRDDVIKSGTTVEEPGLKVGGLRNLKSLFESGQASNVEVKPRQVAQRKPAGLDSIDPSDTAETVTENTPEVRDDLVRETPRSDNVDVASGHSRSLKNKWEAGEMERPDTNYKTVVTKEEPQVAESEPEPQREDVVTGDSESTQVHIEAGSSKSLKERFESEEGYGYISPKYGTSQEGYQKAEEMILGLTRPGGLRSVKDQFEGGNVSNVEIKKMIDEEVIRLTGIQNGKKASGIVENEPIVRDDVIREGNSSDDLTCLSGGMKLMKDRFENGKVSTEGDITPPSKIDLSIEIERAKKREEEVRRSDYAVLESEPVVLDDVVRESDATEDFKPESGILGSLKDRFEGSQENQISRKKIDANAEIKAAKRCEEEVRGSAVLENEPEVLDDVVRETDVTEDIKIESGTHKSLKDRFENGKHSGELKGKFDVILEIEAAQRREEELRGSVSAVLETEPVVLDGVIREADTMEDIKIASGRLGSLKEQFENGKNHHISASKIDVNAEIEALRRDEEARRSVSTVTENEPVILEDVVRSGDATEDVKPKSGVHGSLKDRFEKGAVSNVEDKPKKEPIKIGSLENFENPESKQGSIYENTPVVRDDLIRSSHRVDDPDIKSGSSRSLKSMFESGPVSNIEEKPKEKIQPRSLDDSYATNPSTTESGISENTPIVRDDVAKASSSMEEPGIKVGGSRNLKNLFESGPVSNIEVKRQVVQYKSQSSA